MIKWSTENDINSFKLIQIYAYNDESSFYARKIDNKTSLNIFLVPLTYFHFSAICFSKIHIFSFIISSLAYFWCPEFSTSESLKLLLQKLFHLKMYTTYCLYFYSSPKPLYFLFFYVVDLSWILAAGISVFCYSIILWYENLSIVTNPNPNTLLVIYEKTCIKYIVDLCMNFSLSYFLSFNFYVRNRWI